VSGAAGPLARFDAALAAAGAADAPFAALEALARETVGATLFTVMTVDTTAMVARRAYTSHPVDYPASGTKPVERNAWFATVAEDRVPFVANTLDEIARVFPDHQRIGALGCASVLNLPVVLGGVLAATVNLLHGAHHFDPARVDRARATLSLPAKAAVLMARELERSAPGEARPAPGHGS